MKTVEALQHALAAEHRAVYVYGVIGARAAAQAKPRVTILWNHHKTRRDDLIAFLQARKAKPVTSDAAYPVDVSKPVAKLAAALESDVLAAYLPMTGVTPVRQRAYAAQAMQDSMTWQVRWSHDSPSTPFPALDPAELDPSASE